MASESQPPKLKQPSKSIITAWLLLIGVFVACNCSYQYSDTNVSSVSELVSSVDFEIQPAKLPVMGGWPFRYFIQYPESETSAGLTRFSGTAPASPME